MNPNIHRICFKKLHKIYLTVLTAPLNCSASASNTDMTKKISRTKMQTLKYMMNVPGESKQMIHLFDAHFNLLDTLPKNKARQQAFDREIRLVELDYEVASLKSQFKNLDANLPFCALMSQEQCDERLQSIREQRQHEKPKRPRGRHLIKVDASDDQEILKHLMDDIVLKLQDKYIVEVKIRPLNFEADKDPTNILIDEIDKATKEYCASIEKKLSNDGGYYVKILPNV